MFKEFKNKNNKINFTKLAKSDFCWVKNIAEVAKKQPLKFDTMYLGIICQENGISLEELATLRESKADIDKEIEELEGLAKAGRYSLLVQIAETLTKVMQSPFTDDAMFQRAEKLEQIRKKILGIL